MLRTVTALVLSNVAFAQGVTFTPDRPMFRIAVHDLPGLVAAAERTGLGRLLADPEVAEVAALAKQRDAAQVREWIELVEALQQAEPRTATFEDRAEIAVRAIDWRYIHSFEISASFPGGDPGVDVPGIDLALGFTQPTFALALHPTDAGKDRVRGLFDAFVVDLEKHAPFGHTPAAEQKIDGHDALVMAPGGDADPRGEHMFLPTPQADGIWLTARPGLFAGGSGTPEVGAFAAREARPPGIVFGVDIIRYARMIASLTSDTPIDNFLRAAELENAGMLEWRLSVADDRVQDELSLAFDGSVGGILGALVRGMAPLPDQPLPSDPLLQVRCAFDVEALVEAVDRLLAFADLRPLTEQGMQDDLRRAWTGGATFGLARPAPGALVPRVYASFGIVDTEALDRLLARLHAQPFVKTRPRELSGVDCTLLDIDGLPSALAPAYCLIDDTFHVAESALSLRALLKARADDAPGVMDVGDAPRPSGPGTMLPMFDLRFDGAAIHSVLREVWLPLMTTAIARSEAENLLRLREMPDVETVAQYLGSGRGVLRRTETGVTLSMSGALGGPETHALATMYAPVMSSNFTLSRRWACDSLRSRLLGVQMSKVHAGVEAFTKREGARPRSLGALLAAGDLEASALSIAGDARAEPVMHGGKQVAIASFRYYPEGLTVSRRDDDIKARLIVIAKNSWWREVMDENGQVLQLWDDSANKTLDELERAAREKATDK